VEIRLQPLRYCLVLCALLVASDAFAADSANGQRLAEARCVTCHRVGTDRRREIADAPPFEMIAQKFSMLDPHPRMNVTLTRREAEDIAAYINTLAK
jgi:mono/diheme cytochrome c family protein